MFRKIPSKIINNFKQIDYYKKAYSDSNITDRHAVANFYLKLLKRNNSVIHVFIVTWTVNAKYAMDLSKKKYFPVFHFSLMLHSYIGIV